MDMGLLLPRLCWIRAVAGFLSVGVGHRSAVIGEEKKLMTDVC